MKVMNNHKQLKPKVNNIAHHALAAPGEVVHLTIHVVRTGHHVLIRKPHNRLRERYGWYDKWHNHRHHHKIHVAILAVYFIVAFTGLIGFSRVAGAFNSFVQTNWSGGVGSNPASEYSDATNVVAADGGVTIGANDHANWCNTANCDTNWAARKIISVQNNDSQSFTDYQLKLHVGIDYQMNSNFSDLRFTNEAGDTDYSYFIQHDYNGQSADVLVKVPSLPQGATKFYMYFGNAAAIGQSDVENTMLFSDHFDQLSGNNGSPYWYGCNDTVFGGGEVSTTQACNVGTIPPYDQLTSLTDLVTEFDYRQDLSAMSDCSANGLPGNYFKLTVDPNALNDQITIGTNVVTDANNCGANAKWYVSTVNIAGYEGNPNLSAYFNPALYQFDQSAYVRFRLINKKAGGVELYYSTDNGVNYSQIGPLFPNNTLQHNSAIMFGTDFRPIQVRNVQVYSRSTAVTSSFGTYQWQAGRFGTLTSAVIDMGDKAYYGNMNFATSGSGWPVVRLRTSSNADMSGATDFDYCNDLIDGSPVIDSSCVSAGGRYFQYQIILSDSGAHDLAVNSVTIEHDNDLTAPDNITNATLKRSATGQTLTSGDWVGQKPYVGWTPAADNSGGSGIAGYCIGLTQNTPNPDGLTKDMIWDASPLSIGGACEYAVSTNYVDLASISSIATLNNDTTYYVGIRPIDRSGNVSSSATVVSFRYDSDQPIFGSLFTPPPAVTNSKIVSASWIPQAPSYDATSGLAGIKYCVSNMMIGNSGCEIDDPNWYGKNHTSGSIRDTSDIVPYSDGQLTTTPADASRLDDIGYGGIAGVNAMRFAIVDNAGNVVLSPGSIFVVTGHASGPVNNLQVNPTSNSVNDFSFTWDPPTVSFGGTATINYCWTVNTPIAANGSNCNWTGEAITELASGAYATKQGVNTMYVSSKDMSGNFDGTQYASVEFTAATIAPGAPQNLGVEDISLRATSVWKTALSWNAPAQPGAGITSYRIYRSEDNVNFSQVGSTSDTNLSFIDSGLSQVLYYYQVKACDNAGSCGVASNTVSKKPTGRYTTPANLTSDQNQPRAENVGNRKATILWFTDRESDSKVAIGTRPGQYNPEEVGSSAQLTNHSVSLTNLQPGTTYYFVTKWTDEDGNTGVSREVSFTTLPAPTIKEISTTNVNVDQAVVNFTIIAGNQAKLYYGKSDGFGGLKSINTSKNESTYNIKLDSLDDGSKYFYKINSVDADGNEYDGNVNSFTTLARPKITNLVVQNVAGEASSTQKVSWDTNVPTSTEVIYTRSGESAKEAVSSGLSTRHEIIVQDLIDDSDYTLAARSRDENGNVALSDTQSFRTALDTRPPKISDYNVEVSVKGTGSEARGQIILSWKTDEPATSAAEYGIGNGDVYNSQTVEDGKLTTDHVVIISDLSPSNVYQVRPVSLDHASNKTVGEGQSAIVGRATDNVLSIIFNTLRRMFGFSG